MKILFLFLTLALFYTQAQHLQMQKKTSILYQPTIMDSFESSRLRIA